MLNNIGLPGLILIAIVALVLFGRGKVSSLMGEVGKGITAFKRGVDEGKNDEIEDAGARDVSPDAGASPRVEEPAGNKVAEAPKSKSRV